jgi:hypothetical protein
MNDGPQPHAGTGFMNGHPIMPFNDPAASNGYSDYTHNTGVTPMLPSTNMATNMPIQPIPGQVSIENTAKNHFLRGARRVAVTSPRLFP